MHISYIEIQNFRKLKSTHIRFDRKQTVFVGANNSGKTSAIEALQMFLLRPKLIALSDITIGNWSSFDAIGASWEDTNIDDLQADDTLLPALDTWLEVPLSDIHHVVHLLPTIDWDGGLLGVRLQYEFKDVKRLKRDFLEARLKAKKYEAKVPEGISKPVAMPRTLSHFLGENLSQHIEVVPYALDPNKCTAPSSSGLANPQILPDFPRLLEPNPFSGVIDIDDIPAGRGFDKFEDQDKENYQTGFKSKKQARTLSRQIRDHHDHHFSEPDKIEETDAVAYASLQSAEKAFDEKLKSDFQKVRDELGKMNIPGTNNPDIIFNVNYRELNGLTHKSAIQYAISNPVNEDSTPPMLPENYAGLGYQNLISMMFLLLRFREDRMAALKKVESDEKVAPLHLVLIEEPEAHLHAQVQQVFISKAYQVLRKHDLLGDKTTFSTQMLVSTHSSHVAHEVDFSHIRYFRRHDPEGDGHSATTGVTDLSEVFGGEDETARFVKRYMKATDCDLFFADAAIFVEGQAERILVPHLIRNHYPNLWQRYTSLIDVGGAHAHRFAPFLQCLGIHVLVMADLDSAQPITKKNEAGVETTKNLKAVAQKGADQVTTNSVLKDWHPQLTKVDELVAVADAGHERPLTDDSFPLYVAYQKSITLGDGTSFIPRTFEDALIAENADALKGVGSKSMQALVKKIEAEKLTGVELADALFDLVNNAQKASFATQCLFDIENPAALTPPNYISKGLDWLDKQLGGATGSDDGEKEVESE